MKSSARNARIPDLSSSGQVVSTVASVNAVRKHETSESESSSEELTSDLLAQSLRQKPVRQPIELHTEVLAELNRLVEIAEEKIPGNQRSPKNQRQMRAFQRKIEKYFRTLETAFPYQRVAAIYNKHVVED